MFGTKPIIGLALEGDHILMARLRMQGNKTKVMDLDTFKLAEEAKETSEHQSDFAPAVSADQETSADHVFGFSNDEAGRKKSGDDDLDLDELESKATEDVAFESLDMVSEAGGGYSTNAGVLYNILINVDSSPVKIALNIQAGQTIFQILSDTDYSEIKKKVLIKELEDRLENIYGQPKSADQYAYEVRGDGSLVLGSIEEPPALLEMANKARELYNGTLRIASIFPDEAALTGLLRVHYSLKDNQITALIQFSPDRCRIVFLRGREILHVMPVINQGTGSANFLNTIFSKLLFQLDTGKVSELDQIIIANNSMGDTALHFFQENFPEAKVQNFQFRDDLFDPGRYEKETMHGFTSAIAAGWAASGVAEELLPRLSFVPQYVTERQKIFKLRWHGIVLLFLIFLSIPTINYLYQRNVERIRSLSSQLEITNARLQQIQPIVDRTNNVSKKLSLLSDKMTLLDSLSAGSKMWSTKFNLLDNGMSDISSSWFTSLSNTQLGSLIEGYALYRNRIPAIIDLFDDATLMNVRTEERRNKKMYKFTILAKAFAPDSADYAPEKSGSIKKILDY